MYRPAELNREVRLHLEAGFPRLWLSGEISNLSRPASGHWYFTLKDERAQLRCALFRNQLVNVEGQPSNGDQVLVRGRLSLYEPRGDYQLIADAMLPAGLGALQQAFEALKRKLEAEGLFDASLKRPLPAFPGRIAVVTSTSGAAIRDILSTLKRRWPHARVLVAAAQVQGAEAVPSLLRALDRVEAAGAEVLILARGGGSIEDLWAFNDERLARRIRTMPMPVISGVGHETDFTIADFVADLRAATPTAAAEAATPDGPQLTRRIDKLVERMQRAIERVVFEHWQRLDQLLKRLAAQHPARRVEQARVQLNRLLARLDQAIRHRLSMASQRYQVLVTRLYARHPEQALARARERLDTLDRRLLAATSNRVGQAMSRLEQLERALHAVSPLAVLERGYALVEDEHGRILSRPEDFKPGLRTTTRIRDFRVHSTVDNVDHPAPPKRQ